MLEVVREKSKEGKRGAGWEEEKRGRLEVVGGGVKEEEIEKRWGEGREEGFDKIVGGKWWKRIEGSDDGKDATGNGSPGHEERAEKLRLSGRRERLVSGQRESRDSG
ncbi:hypothetical protein KM043_006050 [Ampulex compressa]|nr:hypothetical protein KM043_006050 [Ampulex compressa]